MPSGKASCVQNSRQKKGGAGTPFTPTPPAYGIEMDRTSRTSSSSCGTATTVLLILLSLATVAVLGYLLYRVIQFNRLRDRMEMEKRGGGGTAAESNYLRYYHRGENQDMYERFENEIADEGGDDYDGKEDRRIKDRQKREDGGVALKGSVVYFHMDGCGHCRRFDPTWRQFETENGSSLKKKGIHLESHDAKDEYTSEMEVMGFPAVIFVDGEGKKVDTFQGTRTVAELVRFARKHGAK